MIYRELGRTGLKVSQLGFGAMRLPMVGEGEDLRINRELAMPMIQRAFEAGVNYIDSAVGYCNSDSQRVVGDALKGWRDKITVSTKNPYNGEDEAVWWKNLEDSLERLQIDCIDIYNFHGISWKGYQEFYEPRLSKWFQKAKDQGLIKRICTSFHDNNEALMHIIDTGVFEVITLQYNMLDRQLEEGIEYAHSKGIGVIVMGPVGGGRLGGSSKALEDTIPGIKRVPELSLRFVLSNPLISMAISGMSTMDQVNENLETACNPSALSEDEMAIIEQQLARLKKMADLYCSGCGYCLPCPNEVRIPGIFGLYNDARVYDFWPYARMVYDRIGGAWLPGKKGDGCTECGLCEEKCPQHLPIRKQLAEAHAALKKSE